MGLDRDPGTLDFFEADIVLLHWVRAQGPAQKRGGKGQKSEKAKKGEGPFGRFELWSYSWVGPRSISS